MSGLHSIAKTDQKRWDRFLQEVDLSKTLFITGLEPGLNKWLRETLASVKMTTPHILNTEGPFVLDVYDSTLRNLVHVIVREQIEAIAIVGLKNDASKRLDAVNLFHQLKNHGISENQLKQMEYLLAHSYMNHLINSIVEWLQPFHEVGKGIDQTIKVLKSHPLIDSNLMIERFIIQMMDSSSMEISDGTYLKRIDN